MDAFWRLIAEIGIDCHPDVVESLAASAEDLETIEDIGKKKPIAGSASDRKMIERLGKSCSIEADLTPRELAAGLRGASAAASMLEEREKIQMVWTGPNTGLVASRSTYQVLLDVINSAESKLFMTSFVAYKIDKVMKALEKALDRGVRVEILLELSIKEGGKVDTDSIKTFKQSLPSAEIYAWKPATDSEGDWIGAVHAKCAVADGKVAFITSANLTSAALKKNMELGVLFRGGRIPNKLSRHLEALVATGVIVTV